MPAPTAARVLQEPEPGAELDTPSQDPAQAAVVALAAAAALAACSADDSNPRDADRPPAAFFDRSKARAAPTLLKPQAARAHAEKAQAAAAPSDVQLPPLTVTALLDWAEDTYPQWFPAHQPDQVADPYVYRHYQTTGHYVGVAEGQVYVLGPLSGGQLLHVGSLADFTATVHRQPRPVDAADAAAVRLLLQCQFAASDDEVAEVRRLGAATWVDQQMAQPRGQTGVAWLDQRGCYSTRRASGFYSINWPSQWMAWNQMLCAPDKLRTRVVTALTEYFVVSTEGVGGFWPIYKMAHYWDSLSAHAFGNFRQLLEAVTLAPAMGEYLNTLGNQKEDANGRVPDENYAREVMQLFTIGLVMLNPDGTPRRDAQGQTLPTFDNEDVRNLARVFTGYVLSGDVSPNLATDDPMWPQGIPTRLGAVSPMQLVKDKHSTLEKRFLGSVIPANTDGAASLRLALDTLFNHSNTGPFFVRQMIQRLVVSNPSPAYVQRVSAVFADNGQGVRGDLRAVFRAIWLDAEARGPSTHAPAALGKLSEPMLRVAQWACSFVSLATRQRWSLERRWIGYGRRDNQTPLESPTVFNFFRPGYAPPNQALQAQAAVAPEFQLVNASSLPLFYNWMTWVIRDGISVPVNDDVWAADGSYVGSQTVKLPLDYPREVALAGVAPALVLRLNRLLCAGRLSAETQALIIDALNAMPQPSASSADPALNRVAAAILMVMATPEYLVQH